MQLMTRNIMLPQLAPRADCSLPASAVSVPDLGIKSMVHGHCCCMQTMTAFTARKAASRTHCAAQPRWNPQNVDNPMAKQTLPSPELTAVQTVEVQLTALQTNDRPWQNHGIQTAYEFGEDIGGLENSWYFGYRKDLYHFDHFLGQFGNAFQPMLNANSFSITAVREVDDSRTMVEVAVVPRGGTSPASSFTFALRRGTLGRRKGCWLVKMLLPGTLQDASNAVARLQQQQQAK